MEFSKFIKTLLTLIACTIAFTTSTICSDKVTAQTAVVQNETAISQTDAISPISIVNSPKSFLNKTVVINAKFDKFSTLGLDYKPAFKSSEEYISFLIKRDDTTFDIPLSEMKLFLKRKEAEKFIELKTDDEIQIKGIVFSDALGDAWVDVTDINLIKKAANKDGVK